VIIGALRTILRLDPPRTSRQAALAIAERFFAERGIATGTVTASEHLRHWEVLARQDIKGSPWVLIDNQTGAVIKSGIPPR
jgi:hypothetical protein